MANFQWTITNQGKSDVLNTIQNGFSPLFITKITLGSGAYTPTASMINLQTAFKDITAIGGGASGPDVLHINATDNSSDDYVATEIGLYLNNGTLFALYSTPAGDPIITKTPLSQVVFVSDIKLTGEITPDMVQFGDTNFLLNNATETMSGIIQIVNSSDLLSDTEDTKALTVKKLREKDGFARFTRLSPNRTGNQISPTKNTSEIYCSLYHEGGAPTQTAGIKFPGYLPSLSNTSDQRVLDLRFYTTPGNNEVSFVPRFFVSDAAGANFVDTGYHLVTNQWWMAQRAEGTIPNDTEINTWISPCQTKQLIIDNQIPFATEAEATAISPSPSNNKIMKPYTTKAAVEAHRPFATEAGVKNNSQITEVINADVYRRLKIDNTVNGDQLARNMVQINHNKYDNYVEVVYQFNVSMQKEQIQTNQNLISAGLETYLPGYKWKTVSLTNASLLSQVTSVFGRYYPGYLNDSVKRVRTENIVDALPSNTGGFPTLNIRIDPTYVSSLTPSEFLFINVTVTAKGYIEPI